MRPLISWAVQPGVYTAADSVFFTCDVTQFNLTAADGDAKLTWFR